MLEGEALYLADTPVTTLQEVEALLLTGAGLIGLKSSPKTLLSVEYDLERVLDLNQSDIRERLRTTAEELIQPWVLAQTAQTIAPTQALGVAVAQAGIEAIKAPSAKNLRAHNLVIYPSNLQDGSSLWVYDETGFISARLP